MKPTAGLVRCVRDAEYAAKKVGDWISGAQVGPGASIKVDCQFFAGSIDARWQRMEHTDDRVFLGWEALRGRPASERFVVALHTVGFVFIITLMLFVISLDIGLIPRNL